MKFVFLWQRTYLKEINVTMMERKESLFNDINITIGYYITSSGLIFVIKIISFGKMIKWSKSEKALKASGNMVHLLN